MPPATAVRAGLAVAVAAAVAAPAPFRLMREYRRAPGDYGFNRELEWRTAQLAPARPLLAGRVGYCFALPPEVAASLPPPAYAGVRVRALLQAQNALAPVVLVAVLGQPRTGFTEPSAEDRARALAALDTLLLETPPAAREWLAAAASGFEPVQVLPGGATLWRRAR